MIKNLNLYKNVCNSHNFNTRNKDKITQPYFRFSTHVLILHLLYSVNSYDKIPCDVLQIYDRNLRHIIKIHFVNKHILLQNRELYSK